MNKTVVVIPARYASQRFPGKILALLDGKPVVRHVYDACVKANVGEVIIATDDIRIKEACEAFGAKTVMTSPTCASGSDRAFEAAQNLGADYIINVQGDEPFLESALLSRMDVLLKSGDNTQIATAYCEIDNAKDINNPNCVKVVLAHDKRCLYFTRAAAPYHHELSEIKNGVPYYRHVGVYGYKKDALKKFVSLKPSTLERLERLEQLRALEAGMVFRAVQTVLPGPGIDTPEDLEHAKQYLAAKKG